MLPCETDVAIVGGGPAGSAAALTLRRYTARSCVVLEATKQDVARAGESVSPAILPLLDFLGVDPAATALARDPALLTGYSWGSAALVQRASLFSGYGPGWNLDRRRFDAALSDAASRAGALVLLGAALHDASRAPDGRWRLGFIHDGASRVLLANEVIDASGRRASFGRRTGARRMGSDRLVGVAASLAPRSACDAPFGLLIEAAAEGWWYAASVPGGRSIVVFMIDADLLRSSGRAVREVFAARFAETVHIVKRYCAPTLDLKLRVSPAGGQVLRPCIGDGWAAAGDAAASFDPLSSLGIGHALSSGVQAARIVHARLRDDHELANGYPGDIAQLVGAYAKAHSTFYQAEQRWPLQAFWRRRQAAAFASSMAVTTM